MTRSKMAALYICRRSFWFNRKLHGLFGVSIFSWVVILFLIFYILGNLELRYPSEYSPRHIQKRDNQHHDDWIQALRFFSDVHSSGGDAARQVHSFLKPYLDVNDSNNLESLGYLWKAFISKENTTGLENIHEDQSPVKTHELLKWGQFLQDSIVDTVVDNARVGNYKKLTPAYRKLSDPILLTLKSIVAEMNTFRKPRRPLGERLNIHNISESSSSTNDEPETETGTGSKKMKTESDLPAWKRLQNNMRRHRLYEPDDPILHEVLENLRTLDIVDLDIIPDSGTQVKMVFWLSDGSRAMSKPRRMPIEVETGPDTYYFDDYERFQAEISAFHLDRIMGFYRVPPVVARYVNVTSEIYDIGPSKLKKTFYPSIVGNQCFYGICSQFCDTPFGVCGNPHLIETSFAFYLPTRLKADRTSCENPWKQSYSRRHPPPWLGNDSYCDGVKSEDLFAENPRRLLDIMDLAVFDFMQTNLDRHHFHTFEAFDNDTNIFLYDNGRAYARSYRDEMDLLAPITQCCLIRLSTLERLVNLYQDSTPISAKMRRSLDTENIHPLLSEAHLQALDRRLAIILEEVHKCIKFADHYETVVIDDGY